MPIYVYRCQPCGQERELLRRVAEIDDLVLCDRGCPMTRVPTTASFGFKTAGGNYSSFSPSHGPVVQGNRKPATIGRGHGLGGRRKFRKDRVAANPLPGGKS